jgi:hypothetical protein
VVAGSVAAAARPDHFSHADNGRPTSADRSFVISKKESMILAIGRDISMVDTAALSPHLGVRVTGVEGVADLLDDAVVSRCLEALKWRGVLLWGNTGMLHRALRYEASSQRTLHRTTIYGDEAWS